MTLVTGTVQDLGHAPMDGTLYARPARFLPAGNVVYAPERTPYKIEGGTFSVELAPGPAVLELKVGTHARDEFRVVIPDQETIGLATLIAEVFPWQPEQVSKFVAERKRAEKATADAVTAAGAAETAAGTAATAAQQTGQDRTRVDQVRSELEEAYDASEAGQALPPRLTETALNATYGAEAMDDPVSAWREKADSLYVGGRVDSFRLSRSDDGDMSGQLGAFFADTNLSGYRRVVGYAEMAATAAVPAGVAVDARGAVFNQQVANKSLVSLGAGALLEHGHFQGLSTDFVPTTGSSTPQAVAVRMVGARATLADVEVNGFAGAAVWANYAEGGEIHQLRVTGPHGSAGVSIPSGDAGCKGVYLNSGCTDFLIDDMHVQDVSIGMVSSLDSEGLTVRNSDWSYIRGQHAMYLQNGTRLDVAGVKGRDVALNLVKVQLFENAPDSSYLASVRGVAGRNIGDCVLMFTATGDLSTYPWRNHTVRISDINGDTVNKLVHLASMRGASISGLVGRKIARAGITLSDMKDSTVDDFLLSDVGDQGVWIRPDAVSPTASTTERITVRNGRIHNAGSRTDTSPGVLLAYGWHIQGRLAAGDADMKDVTMEDVQVTATNGTLRYGGYFQLGDQASFRHRRGSASGHSDAAYRLQQNVTVAEWSNNDGTLTYAMAGPVMVGTEGVGRVFVHTSAPATGAYRVGDRVVNQTPAAGQPRGWRCTAAGSPGTWVSEGSL